MGGEGGCDFVKEGAVVPVHTMRAHRGEASRLKFLRSLFHVHVHAL